MITLELCRDNSLGSHYRDPSVIETWDVATEEEAEAAIAEKRPNNLFVRRQGDPLTDQLAKEFGL